MNLLTMIPVLVAETEEPFDPNTVTPGVFGFLATIVVIGVVIVLARDMVRRIRRTQYRAEVNERLDAEQSSAGQHTGDQPSTDQTP